MITLQSGRKGLLEATEAEWELSEKLRKPTAGTGPSWRSRPFCCSFGKTSPCVNRAVLIPATAKACSLSPRILNSYDISRNSVSLCLPYKASPCLMPACCLWGGVSRPDTWAKATAAGGHLPSQVCPHPLCVPLHWIWCLYLIQITDSISMVIHPHWGLPSFLLWDRDNSFACELC